MAGGGQEDGGRRAARHGVGTLLVLLAVLVAMPACSTGEPAAGTDLDGGVIGSPGCEDPDPSAVDGSITSGGDTRHFEVDLPDGDPSQPRPLVLNIHGAVSTASRQHERTGFARLAKQEGFVLLSPDASHAGDDNAAWDLDRDGDDLQFLQDLLDEVEANLCIDLERVYATGFSQGGILSLTLGCDQPERFAAIAPVAGMVDVAPCASDEPVPLMAVHGTADPTVGYDGRVLLYLLDYTEGPTVPELTAGWARRNGCPDPETVVPGEGPIDRQRFACPGGAVELVSVVDGGHEWPGGVDEPAGSAGGEGAFDASEEIWRFFVEQAPAR